MARAHVSEADWNAINAAFAKWVLEHGHQPADQDWPEILGPELFKRAVKGAYFPPGANIALDRDNTQIEGFTVQSGTRDEGPGGELSVRYYALLKDGKEIARKDTPSLEVPDPDAWAKELGYTD